jgi:hypothetical protein
MHIEKNVTDSILGTILDIKGKTKDNLTSLTYLVEMSLRPKLHTYMADNCSLNIQPNDTLETLQTNMGEENILKHDPLDLEVC